MKIEMDGYNIYESEKAAQAVSDFVISLAKNRKEAVQELDALKKMNAKLLAALKRVDAWIPDQWGEDCFEGIVTMELGAEAIEAVQAAIAKAEGKA